MNASSAYVIAGAGLAGAKAAETLRERREFLAFWLAGGRVLAGMNVNIWDASDMIQALVRGGGTVDPGRLADPSVPLDQLTGD